MADYRELLRRAIDALPDNTGANRRAVYEKARGALVAQLRAIDPPLPAREITQHRLSLEDCIRQVEQEATDKLLGRLRTPEPEEVAAQPEPAMPPEPEPEPEPEPVAAPEPVAVRVEPVVLDPAEETPDPLDAGHDAVVVPTGDDDRMPVDPEADALADQAAMAAHEDGHAPAGASDGGSIEDIIAAAESARMPLPADAGVPFASAYPEGVPGEIAADSLVAPDGEHEADAPLIVPPAASLPLREEPAPRRGLLAGLSLRGNKDKAAPLGAAEAPATLLVDVHGQPLSSGAPAISSVREVEPEPLADDEGYSDAQGAVDRAIEALDREARGETAPAGAEEALVGDEVASASAAGQSPRKSETRFVEEDLEERGGGVGALTVFLTIAILLLAGGGAAGFWAWREGYVDFGTIFAQGEPTGTSEVATSSPTPDVPVVPDVTVPDPLNGGADTTVAVSGEVMEGEELPFVEPSSDNPAAVTDERLPSEATPEAPVVVTGEDGEDPVAAVVADGPQSLLLEEQPSGAAGAVPYSGSVTWSRGTDELGNPTIRAVASIPARNLTLEMLLRRNADVSLPASHLMEINFTVSETFVGGTIASLPGVLLKNDELVQGTPLTGASARIVGNSFLFALSSASPRDVETNVDLLGSQGWLDVAMVYGTGRRAIMTLEKGEDGAELFDAVLAEWAALDAAGAASAD